jgi:hypothetical protein
MNRFLSQAKRPTERAPWAFILRAALVNLALLMVGCAGGSPARIGLSNAQTPVVVSVKGLDARTMDAVEKLPAEQRQDVLRVWVAEAGGDAPAMLGEVGRRGEEIVFTPRYPFVAGMKYRAKFDASVLGKGQGPIETEFAIAAVSQTPVARVAAIYPSGDELPENLLKFYIHFSAPMSRGEAYQRVQLVDQDGKVVREPFLELSEELWNPQMTRFTLFFEPGRVKEGLVPRAEMGPALVKGRSYTLVVDGEWRDGEGRAMVESAKKTFRVVAADHGQPDPSRWLINSPVAGTKEELTISFDEPLDHAMLGRVLAVRDADGRELPGTVAIDEHEQRWVFTPLLPWQRGRHAVMVASILEDMAGNSIGRAFEVDLNKGAAGEKGEVVEIRFEVAYRNGNKS